MGQAQQKRRAVLIFEDDAELRSLTVALLEDEQLNIIECESAEAALAVMLIGGQHVALIFADIRLLGVVLTSGHPLDEHMRQFPPNVAYIPKPWQPLNLLVAAEEALALH